ncbi:MAG: hypothetical protein HY542_02965 [Deltaproteobacteria bacterium]|nr:hypothetical protein [Deltaproteobacteria bacterium]
MRKIAFIFFLLLFTSSPLIAEEGSDQWSQSGTVLEDPAASRKGFFLSAGPHAGAIVSELGRVAAGAGLRAGYGITHDFLVYLQNDWTVTTQFDVFFHFLDFYPHVAYFIWKDLYLVAGGGYSIARTSTGTAATGFSVQRGVTRRVFGGGGGIGCELFRDERLSVHVELETIYRKISGGNYLQPEIHGLLSYHF